MRRIFSISILLVALAIIAVPAAAQVEISVPSDDGDGMQNVSAEVIDDNTAILSSTYHADRGVLSMTIYSNIGQRITVTDGGALTTGSGRIPRKTIRLKNGRNQVTIPVTEASGRVAAVVDTGNVLYGHVKRIGDPFISGPWTQKDVQWAALSASSAAGLTALLMVLRHLLGRSDEPEVIA